MSKACRQQERRKRLRKATSTSSTLEKPSQKKAREDMDTQSKLMEAEPELMVKKPPWYLQYIPGTERPAYSNIMKDDLVCRIISKDRTRSLEEADFSYINTYWNVNLENHCKVEEL